MLYWSLMVKKQLSVKAVELHFYLHRWPRALHSDGKIKIADTEKY